MDLYVEVWLAFTTLKDIDLCQSERQYGLRL